MKTLAFLLKRNEDRKRIGCWPFSHNLLSFDIQNSIQETLQILKTIHNLPKELNSIIIKLFLNIVVNSFGDENK